MLRAKNLIKTLPFYFTFIILLSFTKVNAQKSKKYTWETILVSMPEFNNVISNPDSFRLELIYTQINRDRKNRADLSTYRWKGNSENYFYPASTVKLPVSCMVLEKMNETGVKLEDYIVFDTTKVCDKYNYISYDREFYRVKEGETISEIAKKYDKDPEDIIGINMFREPEYLEAYGLLNISREKSAKNEFENDLSNMLIFSDNNIFNHMYDYLGHERINTRLRDLGYKESCINRRLLYCDSLQNLNTIGFNVYCYNDSLLYREEEKHSKAGLCEINNKSKIGKTYYGAKGLVNKPKDFTYSNRIMLKDLHKILMTLIYPECFSENECFNIDDKSRNFLLKTISLYPDEVSYQNNNYYGYREDGYTKYLFVGNSKSKIDSNIRIFNIVGKAYGFITDCAYVVDFENNIEFFLSFTIYTNSNNILGDNLYEYNDIAFPFAEKLGKQIYKYELSRKRKRPSELNHIKKILEIN